MDPDFEELSNDVKIINQMKQFSKATDDIEQMIDLIGNPEFYDTLANADKIRYNLMMSFALNSLFWMYLRAEGVDPFDHQVKHENVRLKQAMARAQEIRDKQTIMPRLNKDVASRFIRHGLWVPNETCEDDAVDSNICQEENWDIVHPDQPTSTDTV